MLMWIMSDRAIPRSFRNMEGFGVHTFRLRNAAGKSTFVKFHWRPKFGLQSVVWLHDQAKKAPLNVIRRQQSTKKLAPSRQSKIAYDPSDPETQRKRKDSANRVSVIYVHC
jgi:Catalase